MKKNKYSKAPGVGFKTYFPLVVVLFGIVNPCRADSIHLTAAEAACPPYSESYPCEGCTWSFHDAVAQTGDAVITQAKQPTYYEADVDRQNCTSEPQTTSLNNSHTESVETEWSITAGATFSWVQPIGWNVDLKFEGTFGQKYNTTKTLGADRPVTVPSCAAIIGWARSRIFMDEKREVEASRMCFFTAPDCNWSILLWDYICHAPNLRSNGPETASWSGSSDDQNGVSDKEKLEEYTQQCAITSPCCANVPEPPPGPPSWWTADF